MKKNKLLFVVGMTLMLVSCLQLPITSSIDSQSGTSKTTNSTDNNQSSSAKDTSSDTYSSEETTSSMPSPSSSSSSSSSNYFSSSSTSSTSTTSNSLLKNTDKGLPSSPTGIYDLDFTKARYVKDVHDQGIYLNGCPTTGDVNVLVVPLEFSDVRASTKRYDISAIDLAFNGSNNANLQYRSVKQYYYESSYGKLNLNFDVLPTWYSPSKPSTYYLSMNSDRNPDQIIINEILQKLEPTMDLSKYDSDNNGTIDAIVIINTLTPNSDITLKWAYRYWNMLVDNQDCYYEYDNVYANDYLWASYQFLHENAIGFNGAEPTNTYTFIHEFGHVLGADDYYDMTYYNDGIGPLDGHDIMDSEKGDHNPYSKFNYGWLTKSRLIVTDSSVTVNLSDFSTSGDTIILANNWDDSLGAYQEYYVLMYYKNNGLNSGTGNGYFSNEGIVMYHVNSTLYKEFYNGETYYDVYNNNGQSPNDEYYTENNLIELVSASRGYVFTTNSTSSKYLKDDDGNTIKYTFKVNSINSSSANLTFTRN